MTSQELLENYEHSLSTSTVIFGVPAGRFPPTAQAGELIKNHGLAEARRIAHERANHFPAAWNQWQQVAEILVSTRD